MEWLISEVFFPSIEEDGLLHLYPVKGRARYLFDGCCSLRLHSMHLHYWYPHQPASKPNGSFVLSSQPVSLSTNIPFYALQLWNGNKSATIKSYHGFVKPKLRRTQVFVRRQHFLRIGKSKIAMESSLKAMKHLLWDEWFKCCQGNRWNAVTRAKEKLWSSSNSNMPEAKDLTFLKDKTCNYNCAL